MNAELPPFKNREHNSESASTIGHVIAPLIIITEAEELNDQMLPTKRIESHFGMLE